MIVVFCRFRFSLCNLSLTQLPKLRSLLSLSFTGLSGYWTTSNNISYELLQIIRLSYTPISLCLKCVRVCVCVCVYTYIKYVTAICEKLHLEFRLIYVDTDKCLCRKYKVKKKRLVMGLRTVIHSFHY